MQGVVISPNASSGSAQAKPSDYPLPLPGSPDAPQVPREGLVRGIGPDELVNGLLDFLDMDRGIPGDLNEALS